MWSSAGGEYRIRHMKLLSLPIGMAGNILNTMREVDVRPIKAAAETPFSLVFASRDMPMAEHLADVLYRGPCEADIPARRTCAALKLDQVASVARGLDVAVIVSREDYDNSAELTLLRMLENQKVAVLICFVRQADDPASSPHLRNQWLPAKIVELTAPVNDDEARKTLVRAIRSLKQLDDLALARHLPAFRESVARGLIDDSALANAAYSFGTGVAELVPGVNVALTAADMLVLTKNQLVMSYKIALAMGMTGEFKDVAPKLVAVLGAGFLFRQAARSLIGLLPGLGIVPKVAVAYAGTQAAGEAILRWCATGERLGNDSLRAYFDAAMQRGRVTAGNLLRWRKSSRKSELRP